MTRPPLLKDYDPCDGVPPTPDQVKQAADYGDMALHLMAVGDLLLVKALRTLVDHARASIPS